MFIILCVSEFRSTCRYYLRSWEFSLSKQSTPFITLLRSGVKLRFEILLNELYENTAKQKFRLVRNRIRSFVVSLFRSTLNLC